ncbi:MAG: sigma-70 family RNA polymerase sigma factor [Spirochaetes bacterium]|nr:sigma-70 family RNA polymerase sigma factor [Spirochaetota bacterium]MBU0956791.1 sigma-70 family RNA polymerase sigma factor [Spirochaetota bacterium]
MNSPIQAHDNDTWLQLLQGSRLEQEQALRDLRPLLLRGLKAAFRGRIVKGEKEFYELAEDFVQEALIQILNKIGTFRGNSRFTTWAHKICIRIALSELRRKRWLDRSLDLMLEQDTPLLQNAQPEPQNTVIEKMNMTWLRQIMAEELTEKQMMAMMALVVMEIPVEEAARRMETNRNALYKLLHDARKKLRIRMQKEGMADFFSEAKD